MSVNDNLFSSRDHFEAIVEQSIAGIYIIQDEEFRYVNATWAKMVDCTPSEMIGRNMRDYVHPDILEEVISRYYKRIHREHKSDHFITKAVAKSGRVVQIEVHGTFVEYQGRPAVAGIGVDVTERLNRDAELKRSQTQLQALAAHIEKIREEQRGKFARELHDVLGGMLTSIKMDVTRVTRRVKSPEVLEITRGLLHLTQETIDTVRKISEELRPSVLDHLGLKAAIEKDVQTFSQRYNIQCELNAQHSVHSLSFRKMTAMYRIFQEAMTNIARHAEASRVDVTLYQQEDAVVMNISDDGVGIDLQSMRIGSIGLLSMSERARAIGGRLDVSSGSNGGTLLHVYVPVD